jgi:uncharacterized protein (TIRG00374 family)
VRRASRRQIQSALALPSQLRTRWLVDTRWRVAVAGAAGSVVFTFLAVRNVDFAAFREGLTHSNYWWLIPALAVLAVTVALRGLRWRLLFLPGRRPPLGATMRALLVGQLFNNILPGRAGEAARILFLHQEVSTPRSEALGTVVAERVYDIGTLLVLLFAALPFLPDVNWVRRAAILAAVFAVIVATVVAVLGRYGARPLRSLLRPLAWLPRVSLADTERGAENITLGLAALHRPRVALQAFALTVLSWLTTAASFWFTLLSFRVGLGYDAGLLLAVATALSMVIPALPASIGVFEAACVVSLGAYGIDRSRALSFAVVLHAVNFFPFVAAGYLVVNTGAWRFLRAKQPQENTTDREQPIPTGEVADGMTKRSQR